MIVLGIDPGTAITGCAVVESLDCGNRIKVLDYGCIRTQADVPMQSRLLEIYTSLCNKIREYEADVVAIEQLYFNRNVTTALAVGQARGAAMLAANSVSMSRIHSAAGEAVRYRLWQGEEGAGSADGQDAAVSARNSLPGRCGRCAGCGHLPQLLLRHECEAL